MKEYKTFEISNFLFALFVTLGIVFISQFLNIIVMFSLDMLTDVNNEFVASISLFTSMFLPYWISIRFSLDSNLLRYIPLILSLVVSVYCVLKGFISLETVVFTYFVAISEEAFFRGLVENFLEKKVPLWVAILVQSLIFALVNHSAYDIVDNLIYRFPAGIMLTLISKKIGLQTSMTIHYIHNMLASL